MFGDSVVSATLPVRTEVVSQGISVPLEPTQDLVATVQSALDAPIDTPPLLELARGARRVVLAFDDPTVPCYAPLWATAVPLILRTLERAGVPDGGIRLICANALHRMFEHDELANILGSDVVARYADRLSCHDAEDPDAIETVGTTESGHPVELNRAVTDSDLTIYLNCSTVRGFSGGWKSVCVGLSTYRSIHRHHTPDIMSMSLDRNKMHAILDEMGAVVDANLGEHRVFKLETVLANPFMVHDVYGGTVGATRSAALDRLRTVMPERRSLTEEKASIVVYGVPDWSPYAAFSHGNPILDLISTGLGYLGGMIQALGAPGCTVVMATPARERWDHSHHASYPVVWERVLPVTRDPDEARSSFEPELAADEALIERYRTGYSFHPVHAVMALYPLKRLRHAGRVIIAGAEDPAIPEHCGFGSATTIEAAIAEAETIHGKDAPIAFVDNPAAANRSR